MKINKSFLVQNDTNSQIFSNQNLQKTPLKSQKGTTKSLAEQSILKDKENIFQTSQNRLNYDNTLENDINYLNLDQINDELDNNMNNMIILMNRRKALVFAKKQKILIQQEERIQQIQLTNAHQLQKYLLEINEENSNEDQNIQNLINATANQTPKMQKIIQQVVNDLTANQERKSIELSRSSDFWETNKHFENQIDVQLQKLRHFDQELDKINLQIQDFCKNLDNIEDNIRDLLINKTENHVVKAEPFFQHKKKYQNTLKQLLLQRNKIKDDKISTIYNIVKMLSDLKALRQERISDLGNVFGIKDADDSTFKINYYMDFLDQLENLAKIEDNLYILEQNEDELLKEIELSSKEVFIKIFNYKVLILIQKSEAMFAEFVKRSSDEAKFFCDLNENLSRRLILQSAIEYFLSYSNLAGMDNIDIKNIIQKFKQSITFMKPLIEEDQAIKQGLKKTNDTIDTFQNILKAISSEKDRQKELVRLLENGQKLKEEEENKNEIIREIELEITKKNNKNTIQKKIQKIY
ncbi:hypothetical protein IMG5_126270 [Ichthyophthirius multifiliis]|uniref:Uncharacterized protein n=1 Tax=Ichthyophthirius multifiliis TaxID=5932 RepID=G0QVT3_ICHMU|nr:hypothetical protein IMG5_126270 [Ichthyophthirius multifiliis]EGR30671.1 hypothetical protein IMG5_126270 [Ichthyophthirius multifiliis]|eukprot:XP_004032258.1 hypothetical protein IMG5_126270 [Ichthyophthirius multifiliis]